MSGGCALRGFCPRILRCELREGLDGVDPTVFWAADGLNSLLFFQAAAGTGLDSVGVSSYLFSDGQNNYYPAYSPDGRFVLFNRSPSNRNSMDNATVTDAGVPDGQLWAVPSAGGTPVHLINASAPVVSRT